MPADNISLFRQNAAKVSSTVVELPNLAEAAAYALSLCPAGGALAAPELSGGLFDALSRAAEARGVKIVTQGLRSRPDGLTVGFSTGQLAVADTASVLMSAPGEDSRLASMLSELHVIAVPKSKLVKDLYEAEAALAEALSGAAYASFISGCSRTSDIERVLTLGVHGPLELHVALVDEEA